MTDVIRVDIPAHLHLGEKVVPINILELDDGTRNRILFVICQLGVVVLIELFHPILYGV